MTNLLPWRKKGRNVSRSARDELDRWFDPFWEDAFLPSARLFRENRWMPQIDIKEGKKDITVKAEIPGVEAKDIDVSLDGRILSIKGEKKQEKEEKDENYYRVESSYGYFNRAIELPADVDPEQVDAAYKKGVLKVKLKKTKPSESSRIQIKSG